MKKIILIPFILLCTMLLTIPASAMENEPDNFRGIPWGAPLPKNNLFGKNKWGLTHFLFDEYHRSEKVVIGGAKISSPIVYYFLDSLGFASAKVSFEGQENYDLIRKLCIESWGEPDREKEGMYGNLDSLDSFWIGERLFIQLSYEIKPSKRGKLKLSLHDYAETAIKESFLQMQKRKGL